MLALVPLIASASAEEHMLLRPWSRIFASADAPTAPVRTPAGSTVLEVAVVERRGDRVRVRNVPTPASCAAIAMNFFSGDLEFWVKDADAVLVTAAVVGSEDRGGSWWVEAGTPVEPSSAGPRVTLQPGVTLTSATLERASSCEAGVAANRDWLPFDYRELRGQHVLSVAGARVTFDGDTLVRRTQPGASTAITVDERCGKVELTVPASWLREPVWDVVTNSPCLGGRSPAPLPERTLTAGTLLTWPGGLPAGQLTEDRPFYAGQLAPEGTDLCWEERWLFGAETLRVDGTPLRLCAAASAFVASAVR